MSPIKDLKDYFNPKTSPKRSDEWEMIPDAKALDQEEVEALSDASKNDSLNRMQSRALNGLVEQKQKSTQYKILLMRVVELEKALAALERTVFNEPFREIRREQQESGKSSVAQARRQD